MATLTSTRLDGWQQVSEHAVSYNIADEGMNTVAVAPGSNKRIKLLAYHLVAEGNVGIRFQDPDDELTGLMDFAANTVRDVVGGKYGILVAGTNKRLDIYQSVSVQVSGHLRYAIERKVT